MLLLQSDLRSAIQIAATFCYINPPPNRYETPSYRRVSVRTPVRTASAALKIVVSDKPPICTADELHYVSIHNSDWRLALWRYKPPPQAPPRNHPLLLLSGVGTNAIGYDLAPGENISGLQKACSAEMGDVPEPLALALQEKVAALLLLSQEEERYLLESNVNAALQNKLEELQRNLIQVTNEKVVALMELAQLKQEYHLLQEKINDDVHRGKVATTSDEKSTFHDKDGRLKGLLKKAYFSQWISPHQQNAQNISSTSTMDFASMKIEYSTLKESLESMEHLTSSIRRLRLSLVKVKESIPAEEDTAGKNSEIIENVVTEAKLLKTALGSSLPVSWSAKADNGVSSAEKVDCVSAAGFEMVELLILASHLVRNSMP